MINAAPFLREVRDFFVSLKLTVALLLLSIILILVATLDQVNLGIWVVQAKYFNTFVVYWPVGDFNLAIFPGGYTLGGLLLLNLVAAHAYRFTWSWKKLGIWLAHAGLVLLLLGQLFTGLWQDEYQLRLDEGETKNYSEAYRNVELAITDISDPKLDTVVVVPEGPLARKTPVQHPGLPFRVTVKTYLPNAGLREMAGAPAVNGEATRGIGSQILVTPMPLTFKPNERNLPAAYVELAGPEGPLGTWLVAPQLAVQRFDYGGRTWKIALRFTRHYHPYTLTLLKFTHDRYPGTQIPRNFSSRLRLTTPDGRDDREVLIYMNNPLRYDGLTFYQAGFENNDRTTVLQVVRNPSWQMPYIACGIMTLGLVWQFGYHLLGFVTRRRNPSSRATGTESAASKAAAPSGASGRTGRFVALLVPALGALLVVASLFPSRPRHEHDLTAFGRLPTLMNGRVKPLDTVARTSLLTLQGRQRVVAPDGRTLAPTEWLLDMFYRATIADAYPVFEVVHPDVLTLLNLTTEDGAGGKRFAYKQLRPSLPELDRQARLADAVESALRTPFQRAVVQLRNNIFVYQSLQGAVLAPGVDDYLAQLSQFDAIVAAGSAAERAKAAGESFEAAAFKAFIDLRTTFIVLDNMGQLRLAPPDTGAEDITTWRNFGAALQASVPQGRLDRATSAYVQLGRAWQDNRPADFNATVHEYRAALDTQAPALLGKSDLESRFNAAQPFYTSAVLYVAAFLVAVFSWLKWPEMLGRAAFRLVLIAWLLSTAGIAFRMWLEGRPPVTNLYSSALFIGWGAVALCLVLEGAYRNGIGSVAAGLVGFATLVIAHHLSLSGDTLEMMRAVLDSNFWLATHVVTVTIGYAATFLAGFLALIYVGRGLFTRSLDGATASALSAMVYGIVCFATLFSFVGTVLGGIWADQSWGRFWGWDPKENGALIIVLWNAVILHARWGGLVKQRGLMALTIFGNIVTSWSWFGTNMLGVGLHSYGFMDSAFWWLAAFMGSQLLAIALACLPVKWWRSTLPGA